MHDEEDEDLDEGECVLCDMRGFLVICELCNQDYCLDCSGLQNQHNVPDGPWYCNQCRPGSSTQHRRRGSASASGNGRGWASAPRGRGAGEGALGGAHEVRRDSRERRSAGSRAGGSHEQLEHGTRHIRGRHTHTRHACTCVPLLTLDDMWCGTRDCTKRHASWLGVCALAFSCDVLRWNHRQASWKPPWLRLTGGVPQPEAGAPLAAASSGAGGAAAARAAAALVPENQR
jgi:hypothetical protein